MNLGLEGSWYTSLSGKSHFIPGLDGMFTELEPTLCKKVLDGKSGKSGLLDKKCRTCLRLWWTATKQAVVTELDPMMQPHVCEHGLSQLPGDTACRICSGEVEER